MSRRIFDFSTGWWTLLFVFMITGLIFIPSTTPTNAQDDTSLSDEEIAQIDRLVEASHRQLDYSSFAFTIEDSQAISFLINLDVTTLDLNETTTVNVEGYVLQPGEDERQVQATTAIDVQENGVDGEFAYSVLADFRYVDGSVYVNAAYDSTSEELEPLPSGWTIIERAEAIPMALGEVPLLDDLAEDGFDLPFNNRELFVRTVTSVEVTQDELEDGTTVEVSTLTITGAGLTEFLLEEMDSQAAQEPVFATLFGPEADGSVVLTAWLDADGNLVLSMLDMQTTRIGVPLSELTPEDVPEQTTVDLNFEAHRVNSYSNFNGDFAPVVAPELGSES